jgi:hypothetical protein
VSSNYTCVQGHEKDATNKLQDYIKRAITNFFKSRRIAINASTLEVNVSLTIQTGADTKPYAAFTGNAGAGFSANLGAVGTPGGAAATPGAAGIPGAAANPGGGAAANPGAVPNPGGGAAGIPGAAANPGSGGAANGLGGATAYGGGGAGLGGSSSPAATVTAKDGTRFNVLFSSGSDTQDTGEYRIIASQRGFTREGNPIGRRCRLRLFESGDFDATRTLLVINASSGHVLGRIPLPSEISVY